MGSHKQRVQRKIKKDVKRKLQNKTRPQTTAAKPTNKMDEVMRMMMLMKGGQQQNPNAAQDLLTAKEIIAKQNAEEARKQRETKQRIKQIEADVKTEKTKAKTQQLTEKEQQLLAMEKIQKQKREAEAKLRATKDEIERNKVEAEVDRLKQKYELEQQTLDLILQSQGLDEESLKARHELEEKRGVQKRNQLELQNKQKQYEIENLEKELQITNDHITETKSKLEKYLTLTGHENAQVYKKMLNDINGYNDFLNSNVIDVLKEIADTKSSKSLLKQVGVDTKLKNANKAKVELSKALRDLKADYAHYEDLNKELNKVNNENKDLRRDIATTQHNIKLQKYITRTDPETQELQIKVFDIKADKDGNDVEVYSWKNAKDMAGMDWNFAVKREVADELADAETDNKMYKTIKKQKDAEYERNTNDILRIDELGHEKDKLNAYNDAMAKITYEDKSAEIAQLEYEIKNLQDQINNKWTGNDDYNKMLRQIKELQNKKTALEQELAKTPTKTISDKQIKDQADAMYEIADTENKIRARRKKNEAVDNFENETEKLQLNNKIKKQTLDKMDDKSDESVLKTIVTNRVEAEQNEKLLAAQQEAKDAEEALKILKWKEEALNSKNIQDTNEKLKQAHIDKAKYENESKQREQLYNAQVDARNKKTMAQVYSSLNSSFTSSNSLTEAETLYNAANAKYDEIVNDIKDEEQYVHEKVNRIRAKLVDDVPLREHLNSKLNELGYNIDGQEWFGKNIKNRVEADAFSNAMDDVLKYWDKEDGWDDEGLDNDEDVYRHLNEAGFIQEQQ